MSRTFPVTLVAPGRHGLNLERQAELLGPEWCIEAQNVVLNREGRVAARKGWANQTTTGVTSSPDIRVLFEYLQNDGTATMITAAGLAIYQNIDDYSKSANDITPSTTPTDNYWQFVNFNGKCIGVQQSITPIVYSGSSSFADISAASGTLPDGNAALSAFGRLWIVDSDYQTIKYSALLDETKWATADGAGSIDMSNVWTTGVDQVQALAAFGGHLVVFGKNHIVFYGDSSGSVLGIDPTNLYVTDTIEGTGTIARDSVTPIAEGDIAFLSRFGVQLLSRVITTQNNPTTAISKSIYTHLQDLITNQTLKDIQMRYSPENGFLLLSLPDGSNTDSMLVADLRYLFQDEDGDLVAPWTAWTLNPTALCVRVNGDVLFGFTGSVGKYSTNLDDAATYDVRWSSPWLKLDPQIDSYLKILKEIPAIIQLSGGVTVSFNWEFDFSGAVDSSQVTYTFPTRAEWGTAQYNIDEYSGGLTLSTKSVDGSGEGQHIRVGVSMTIDGFDFVLQQIKLLFKLGRLAA